MIAFVPPDHPERLEGPLVFLAGPIQGALDWQKEASSIISPHFHVASPRTSAWETGLITYEQQVDWETRYLMLASKRGGILFWLAKEAVHDCNRAYAQTTRFELGEWIAKYALGDRKIILSVGIEEGFTGAKYIRRRLSQDCPQLTIHSDLKSTCDAIVDEVDKRKNGTNKRCASCGISIPEGEVCKNTKACTNRRSKKLPPLSPQAKAARAPRPPEELMDALQDRIHDL